MGFADPLGLIFTGLVGVLVLFYLLERRRRAIVVPSLLLWQTLRQDVIRARRFRPDLLFFIQLLLLLALIAGLAKPYLRGAESADSGERHILVLDTSASMQAAEGRSSRIELARARALELVAQLRPLDEVMVVEAGASPRVVVDFTRERAVVENALTTTVATDAAGDVSLAVEFAEALRLRSDVATHVTVFTDMPREVLPIALRPAVRFAQFGETDDNVGIAAVQVFQSRFQDHRGARVYVGLQNFSHRKKHGVLTVSVEGQVVDRRGFTLPSRETAGFLIRNLPGPGRVTAALDGGDALAADDIAYGWVRPAAKPRILLVSAPGALVQDFHRLATSNGLAVTDAQPSHYDPRMGEGFDLIVFHQFVPEDIPAANALYIFPPDSAAFRVTAEVSEVEIFNWDERHPVLESVQPLSSLPLRRVRVGDLPPWSRGLLWSRTAEGEFPLAFAGEREGKRAAFIAFDLAGERLLANDNLDLFLFFMNLLGWLLPGDGGVAVMATGSVWAWPALPAGVIEARGPDGGASTLPAGTETMELPDAGMYTVRSAGERRVAFANFFEPAESDIGRGARPPLSEEGVRQQRSIATEVASQRQPLWAWFCGFAALLLLLEWAFASRRA